MGRIHPSEIPVATVIGVEVTIRGVTVQHVGIVTDRRDQHGLPYVISASRKIGRVKEETWAEFTGREVATILNIRGRLPAHEVLRRARSRLREEWSLVFHNCEHYVFWSHGLEPQSPQLQKAVAGVAVTTLALGALVAIGKALSDD